MKKIIIISLALIVALIGLGAAGYAVFKKNGEDLSGKFDELKTKYPQMTEFTDEVLKWSDELKKDPANVENYSTLGLAWKGLADRAHDLKLEDEKYYYGKALEIYEKGVEMTERKNILFMVNAGNMAQYLEDYLKAEEYYKEAKTFSPGDAEPYIKLVQLYENKLNKTKEEIVAVFDEGIARMIDPAILEKYKKSYLERVGSGQ